MGLKMRSGGMVAAEVCRTISNGIERVRNRYMSGYGSSLNPLHVCVAGSGPAGFYTAEKLLKKFENAKVDMIERLPSPFGLVRSGVAPDHPETKVVINQFTRVATHERCTFFGNVRLGQDVSLEDLRKLYHVVVLAYGAESDRELGISGENLAGVHSAREFVWWYNGHPECVDLPIDLRSSDTAVIIGQGNVGIDAARILLRPVNDLATTDIAEHALSALRESRIRRVYMVGRRGPVQAACTAKEFREMLGMTGVQLNVQPADLSTSPLDLEELKLSRSHKRMYELFCKASLREVDGLVKGGAQLHFVFFRSPTVLLASPDGSKVAGIQLEKTMLKREGAGEQLATGIGEFEELRCGLVLKSVGYKSLPVPGLAFDPKRGVVPNIRGRVLVSSHAEETIVDSGLYVVGWLKRGPTGIIATNLVCAEETVEMIAQDVNRQFLAVQSTAFLGGLGLQGLLQDKMIHSVSFRDWQKINQKEIELGLLKGKPREKIVNVQEMLGIAKDTSC